jgi:hypothetical protein
MFHQTKKFKITTEAFVRTFSGKIITFEITLIPITRHEQNINVDTDTFN